MKNDAEVLKGLEQLFIEVIDKEGGGKYEDFFFDAKQGRPVQSCACNVVNDLSKSATTS